MFFSPQDASKLAPLVYCHVASNAGPSIWSNRFGSRTIDLELTTLSSTNHVELTSSDAGLQDRYIVQETIKELAKNRPIDTKGKRGIKRILPVKAQYVPRILRMYPLYTEVTITSGIVTETAWAGAAWNLSLYMLASHYLISIEREDRCWQEACERKDGSNISFLYCDDNQDVKNDFLTSSCPFLDPGDFKNSTTFNFGIFTDALKSGVVESHDFWKKFFYCFWWGLRNLRFENA
ncbi:unnamed protein product [Cochlearia groenlandica]